MATNIVQMKDGSGNNQYPVTSAEAVGMPDGSGNLQTYLNKRVTELNISVLYPTNGEGGTNKYTLAGAIAQVPQEYRTIQGLKITFINNATSKTETWRYDGGTFTTTANWIQGDGSGGNKILVWAGDVASTRQQVLQQDRKEGLQISYKPTDSDWVNEQYFGTSFTDAEWIKDENWKSFVMDYDFNELQSKFDTAIPRLEDKMKDIGNIQALDTESKINLAFAINECYSDNYYESVTAVVGFTNKFEDKGEYPNMPIISNWKILNYDVRLRKIYSHNNINKLSKLALTNDKLVITDIYDINFQDGVAEVDILVPARCTIAFINSTVPTKTPAYPEGYTPDFIYNNLGSVSEGHQLNLTSSDSSRFCLNISYEIEGYVKQTSKTEILQDVSYGSFHNKNDYVSSVIARVIIGRRYERRTRINSIELQSDSIAGFENKRIIFIVVDSTGNAIRYINKPVSTKIDFSEDNVEIEPGGGFCYTNPSLTNTNGVFKYEIRQDDTYEGFIITTSGVNFYESAKLNVNVTPNSAIKYHPSMVIHTSVLQNKNDKLDYCLDDVAYLLDKDTNKTTYADADALIAFGSSLTWDGYKPKGLGWLERLNDIVDVNIINSGVSGSQLSNNIDNIVSDRYLTFEDNIKISAIKARWYMFNNQANGTPVGFAAYEQLKRAKAACDMRGAQMLICGEGNITGENGATHIGMDRTFRAFSRDYNVPCSAMAQVWKKCNKASPYGGFASGVHGGYRFDSSMLIHAELLSKLPIRKSVKMFKIREELDVTDVAELQYSTNLDRNKIWRAICCGYGNGTDNKTKLTNRADSLDYVGVPDDSTCKYIDDVEYRSETSMMIRGVGVVFYNYALIEFIVEKIQVSQAKLEISSDTEPSAVYVSVDNVFNQVNFKYVDGIVKADLEGNISSYDKIKIIIYANGMFTLSKPIIYEYDGLDKRIEELRYEPRTFGKELNPKTSCEDGWTGGIVKEMPSGIDNYTGYNDIKKHLELVTDEDVASKTIPIVNTCSKIAVRIVATLFPKICNTRIAEGDYVTATDTIGQCEYVNGDIIVSVNNESVQIGSLQPYWFEHYFIFDVDPTDTDITIKIERSTTGRGSTRPVLIHDVSIQDIS